MVIAGVVGNIFLFVAAVLVFLGIVIGFLFKGDK